MKKFWFIAIILGYQVPIIAQVDSTSVLTIVNYYMSPAEYVSGINPENIATGVLIDREHYNDIILEVDGIETVTTIGFKQWLQIFRGLRYANFDTNFLSPIDSFEYVADLQYSYNRTYPIGIMDFEFNKIKQSALDNGALVETEEGLIEEVSTPESFSTHRAVTSNVLSHGIFGDLIRFYVGNFYFFTNNTDENRVLQTVEIDFGNGEGFKTITMNEEIQVQYSSESGFITLITKLTYINSQTEEVEIVYAHSTVRRNGTSSVMMPDPLPNYSSNKTDPIMPFDSGYYPGPPVQRYYTVTYGDPLNNDNDIVDTIYYNDNSSTTLKYTILYAPQNTEKNKLRRPIIICDGFDPGNRRDYYRTNLVWDAKRLPKNTDERGLFQLANGDNSPWYNNPDQANLIADLRNDGYDIVFVDFMDGAGDIRKNAGVDGLRGFLNDVINGSNFRDNKTEEAVLIGPSMGGLISRLAQIQMQEADPFEDPYVKIWISFDSPNKGANIPIGLQYSIEKLAQWNNDPSKLNILKSAAGKQMLVSHYASYNSGSEHSPMYDHLYDDLLQDKYPIYAKNYAISNGGTSKLFDYSGNRIVYFQPKLSSLWALHFVLPKYYFWFLNSIYVHGFARDQNPGYRDLMVSYNPRNGPDIKGSSNQIGYDNAPGGWYAVPYLINYHEDNRQQQSDDSNIRLTRSTFMATTSAFGVEVDYNNVHNTWEDYTGRIKYDPDPSKTLTPFDEVYGMTGICEEHVRISKNTGDYLIDEVLQTDFDKSQRPRNRLNATINQNVNGPVAYTAKEKFTFGGSGNTYTAQSNADINIKAGEEIVFLPGFSTEDGANITAEITNVDYSTVFMKTNVPYTKPVDYSKQSPYLGQVFNYGTVTGVEDINKLNHITIYPNPVKNELAIQLKGFESYTNLELHIYSSTGKLVYSGIINANQAVTINVSTFAQGVYYCKVVANTKEIYQTEFVKIK